MRRVRVCTSSYLITCTAPASAVLLPCCQVFTENNRPFANLMEARRLKMENLIRLRESRK